MKKRSRAHEAGSVEAGWSLSKSIFFANRVVGAVVCNQIDAASARKAAKSNQPGRDGPSRAPRNRARTPQDRAVRSRIDPARASGAARSSESASQDAPSHSAHRPAGRMGPLLDRASSNFVIDLINVVHDHRFSASPGKGSGEET